MPPSDDPTATPGYPIILRLDGAPVTLIGGGTIATRRAEGLHASGALLTVISPTITPALAALAHHHIAAPYDPAHLPSHTTLLIAATDDPATNARAVADARARHILTNRVDAPALGDWHAPALTRHGPITLTIDTSGASPTLTRRLRDRLATLLTAEEPRWLTAATLLATLRPLVRPLATQPLRRAFWIALTPRLLAADHTPDTLLATLQEARDEAGLLELSDEVLASLASPPSRLSATPPLSPGCGEG